MYEIYCKLRDEKSVKDADVARETGITKSTFTDWKNGRSVPGNEKMKKIADYFSVSLDYLLTGETLEIPPLMPEQFELLELYSKLKDEQKTAIINLLRSFSV
jgi:transcriptional regulator with XRE-family HTH domain